MILIACLFAGVFCLLLVCLRVCLSLVCLFHCLLVFVRACVCLFVYFAGCCLLLVAWLVDCFVNLWVGWLIGLLVCLFV